MSTALDAVEVAERELVKEAECAHHVSSLEDERHVRKIEAIERIAATSVQPVSKKPHSLSSAESQVELDDEYRAFLTELREAGRRRMLAGASAWAARQRAELAVRLAVPAGVP
ncbi:MAG TPA: hypothetical protein PKA66_07330 [Gemmatimonadales bacterium]|nr:hypothetical protein [Gemmatimonadales bacterium]